MSTYIWPSTPVSVPGVATEATLLLVEQNTADTVTELQTLNATDFSTETTLTDVKTAVESTESKSPSGMINEKYDYQSLTYVGATTKVDTIVYKLGGAGGTTVATQTFAYDGSDRLTSVTKS